jgi:hypothetical protein
MTLLNPRKSWCVVLVGLFLACGGSSSSNDGGAGGGLVVSADLTTATSWVASAADCDVTVQGVVNVKAPLVIGAGVKVCFQANAGLLVTETGSLNAAGTASNRITFTGTSATPGYWKGLAFLSNDSANLLDYVDVSYAGADEAFCCGFFNSKGDAKAGVVVGDYATTARVVFSHSTISHSGHDGLWAFDQAKLEGFTGNAFTANAGVPVSVHLTSVSAIDATSTYSGGAQANGSEQVNVLFANKTTSDVTLHALSVPFGMSAGMAGTVFQVGGKLTIEAGATLQFEANSGVEVEATGTLATTGTAAARVMLTGRSQVPGFWKGVALLSLGNTLTNTDLTWAGNDDPFCCGYFEPSSGAPNTKAGVVVGDYHTPAGVTLTDVNVTHSANRGVSKLMGTVTQAGTNDLTTGNGAANLL